MKVAVFLLLGVTVLCNAGGISIIEASYGKNCRANLYNNQRTNLGRACNGKQRCTYRVDHRRIGDPAPGCAKTYVVRYRCPYGGVKSHTVPAEASGKRLTLLCGSLAGKIRIVEASYGKNCRASNYNNQKRNLNAACGGRRRCTYKVNHHVIGDAAPGCAKTYVVRYRCGRGGVRRLTVAKEASGKSFSIVCRRRKRRGIRIVEASYGKNCRSSNFNNQKSNLKAACGGRRRCTYKVNHHVIGDSAPGCAKTYVVRYRCGRGAVRRLIVSKEASGKKFTLVCRVPRPWWHQAIHIVEASYGKNCRLTNYNNQKGNLQAACGGRRSCSYKVNHRVIGDSAPGCAKTYVVRYRCGWGPVQKLIVPKEASGKGFGIRCAARYGKGRIRVVEASYGKNCRANLYNNQKQNLRKACNGRRTCRYRVDHRKIGDPSGGCAKTYVVRYRCGHGGTNKLTLGKEATGGVFRIKCPWSYYYYGHYHEADASESALNDALLGDDTATSQLPLDDELEDTSETALGDVSPVEDENNVILEE